MPIQYMAFRPSVLERRELMQQDDLGVFRPKQKYKLVPGSRFTWLDILQLATVMLVDWQVLGKVLDVL